MKKFMIFALCAALLISAAACSSAGNAQQAASGSTPEQSHTPVPSPQQIEAVAGPTAEPLSPAEPADEPQAPDEGESGGKALVVYFSWSGNTESVALEIAGQTGADVFELVPLEPYTDDYNTLLDVAQQEQRGQARPEISGSIGDIAQYDVVYVGFPIWWGDMPMILYTFFDTYDLSGKTVAPFCTSGGSGFSNTIRAMESLEPDARMLEGLHIGSSGAAAPADRVAGWLGQTGAEA